MCTRDADCLGNLVCYAGGDAGGASTCLCNGYYGFSPINDTCNGVLQTPTSLFWVITGAVLLCLGTCLIAYSLWETVRQIRHGMFALDPQTVGNVQVLVGAMLAVVAVAGNTAAALQPERAHGLSLEGSGGGGDKQNDFALVWLACASVGAVFVITGAMSTALSMLEVADRCSKMVVSSSTTSTFRPKLLFAIEAAAILLVLVPILVQQKMIALLVSYVLELATTIVYVIGAWRISRVIRTMWMEPATRTSTTTTTNNTTTSSSSSSMEHALRRMQRSAVIICVCFLGSFIASTLMLVPMVRGWRSYAKPGNSSTISMQIWALQLLFLAIFVAGAEIVRFTRESTGNKLRRRARMTVAAAGAFGSKQREG